MNLIPGRSSEASNYLAAAAAGPPSNFVRNTAYNFTGFTPDFSPLSRRTARSLRCRKTVLVP